MSVEAAKPKAVNRAAAVRPAAAPLRVQTFSNRVSSPKDPAEREAEATAKKIMRMPVQAMRSPYIARFAETGVARQGTGQAEVTSNVATGIQSGMAGGSPLPPSVRGFMEPRFRADFGSVKVHTGEHAARLSTQLNAQAFTVGNHVFFGRDKFRPESDQGKELIAHELTHTIQQGSVIQRSEDATVTQTSPVQVQRFGLGSVLNFFADWANAIPGFRMFTIVIGFNPINMSAVDRSPANILRAVVEFMPGGILITKALDNYGVFDRVGTWVEQQLRSFRSIGSTIRQGLLDLITPSSFLNPRGAWNKAERLFSDAIARIKSFLTGLAESILKFIKDAILRPLAQLASQTSGWDLLKAVLGRDPITGDPVPQDAAALIGGFMKLIGQQEVYDNLKKSNALGRAAAWFRSALGELLAFVRELPSLFLQALKDLTITDIVLLPMAFVKVGRVFGSFAGRFISWALLKVLSLLEIIFDVLAPSVMPYLRKAAGAFKTIIQNPIGFVGNLVKAAMLGFRNFASNIGEHLKAALIDWLTGSLPGVYIPKSFELGELVKFVLSVLGISWQNVRAKLVKVIGETAVGVLEKGFDVVVTLVKDGPAAAWDKIKEHLANLRDMVINGIVDMVIDMVAKRAVPKIVAMFIPGAGFLSAILSIVDTVQVFVSKLSRIAQVVASFIDSIASIASGAVAGAAKRVESTLAGLLSLAISFLAGFAGLGKVSDKIMGVINKVLATIDKALDRLIDWIVMMAKKLFAKAFGKPGGQDSEKQKKIDAAILLLRAEEGRRMKAGKLSLPDAKAIAASIKLKAPVFQTFNAFEEGAHIKYRYTASPPIVINGPEELPKHDVNESDIEAPETEPGASSWDMTIFVYVTETAGKRRDNWVAISIPMDPQLKIPTQPPTPSMVIEGRVLVDGKKVQLRLNGGAITEYALQLIIDRYKKKFGDLSQIDGSLADDNKLLFQIAYADFRSKGVDEDSAKMQAIMKTPFGKYRVKLKYVNLNVELKNFEWAIIPKLSKDPKARFFVPTTIHVTAKR